MEHPEKISYNFPKLSQFKGQPWSSLITFLNETYSSKGCEEYGVKSNLQKELDTEVSIKSEMDTSDLSRCRGQPWSSWIDNINSLSGTSKTCEEYGVKSNLKKELDTEASIKSEMDTSDLSRCRGQPWSSWIDNIDINSVSESLQSQNRDTRVTRLPRQDMGLFGICPENERFCAVICSTCGAVVKAQALQRHLELKHTSDSETALLPPPQVPVKKTKTASVKMKNKEPATIPLPVHSSENVVPLCQSVVSVKQIDTSTGTSSSKTLTSKVSTLPTIYETETYSHVPRRKSPIITNDRKTQKSREKDVETEKHSNEDSKQSSSRTSSSKSQLSSPRRSVTGRTKDFNKLVAEHRATKEQPPSNVTSKSRSQLILKTVVATPETGDSGFSSSSSPSLSSQSTNQDTSPVLDVSPLQTSPPSPSLALNTTNTSTCLDTPSTSPPAVTAAFSSSEYLVNSGSSACSSPTIVNTDTDISISTSSSSSSLSNPTALTISVSETSDSNSVSTVSTTQVVQVVPHTHTHTNAPSHSFTVKLARSGSPIIIMNNNNNKNTASANVTEPSAPAPLTMSVPVPVPSVNLNVNTESISSSNVPVMSIPSMSPLSQQQLQPVIVSRDVIESLNVPVVMEMPTLSDSLTNITVYTSYPKPLVVSTFSAKKVGHTVVFSNRRLGFIRSQFKSVLKKNRRVTSGLNVSMKSSQSSPVVSSAATVFGVKTLNATTACRFPKTTTTASGLSSNSLLAHRPNILRTTSPKHTRDRDREQNVPKILTTGLKRPASSSPQLAGLDCKHMLLKPTANNISGIIGKMIVQHDMTDSHSSEGPTANHLAHDKVVPVNIK